MAVDFKDYYRILGVDRKADDKTIKSAYRRLAQKASPGRREGKDGAERFKEISEAYEVLSDPEKRRRYDTLGPDWQRYTQAPPGGHAGGVRSRVRRGLGDAGDFSEFFRTIFGDLGGRARRGPRAGGDRRIEDLIRRSGAPARGRTCRPASRSRSRRPSAAPARRSRCEVEEPCATCHGAGHVSGKPCARAAAAAGSERAVRWT